MRRNGRMWVAVLAAAWLAGCGGSGGGSGDTATISGTLTSPSVARSAASGGPYYVEAVDEGGTTQDAAGGITAGFRLHVPAGHDYVLVVGDGAGPIGGMRYGAAGRQRSEFRVQGDVDLGEIEVDDEEREVRCSDDSEIEEPDHADRPDNDDDGIPDHADADDDNDGISDGSDDMEKDHDNDGQDDDVDMDDDNDGVSDDDDDHPMDIDDDGEDDDRDQCDRRSDRGAELWIENDCGSCHGVDGSGGEESIRGINVNEIVHALKRGEGEPGDDEYMPAYPELVRYGTDFRAFLGCNGDDEGVCTDGDAANGETVFEANCADCHTAAEVGDEDAEEIAEVLAEGEDEMAAMPDFVDDAADIAAYLAGCATDDGGAGPIDTDMDGVADDLDLCPDTPAGTQVGQDGCPVDQGGGTPTDTDMDGVSDAADQCPGTPAGASVDADGCADTDGDGVFDYLDQCVDTAAGVQVDTNGCEVTTNPGPDGAQVFADNCARCHLGSLGSGGGMDLTRSDKIALIRETVGGGHSGANLSSAEFQALDTYLTNWAP